MLSFLKEQSKKPTLEETMRENANLENEEQLNIFDYTQNFTTYQLREMYEPSTTSLVPPAEKVKTKGRPLSKVDTSTKRDPSYFEFVELCNDSHSPSTTNSVKIPRKEKFKGSRTRHLDQGIENMHGRSVPRKKRNKRLHSTKGKIWMAQPLEECEGSNLTEEHVLPLTDPYTLMITSL
ncbi:Uncharacterized protein Fot_42577 [Forsythia ovata]|uniref:Uncharacterized protein n=1 Tax=Forsythia ovata TaxID=205694 RepID=A0ABD1RLK4_9LAMI